MDKLTVSTIQKADGTFDTRWQWWQNIQFANESPMPKLSGVINVSLYPKWTDDKAMLAEISAIHHLLCVEEVHGKNRLGVNLEIEVSFNEICLALDKESIKKTGRGLATALNTALFTKFLSTRFFEANVKLLLPEEFVAVESEKTKDFAITVRHMPSVDLWSPVGAVSISRHALNRVVQRRMANGDVSFNGDLIVVPDAKWTRSWKWLKIVLQNSTVVEIPPHTLQWYTEKYGDGISALLHSDSQSIFVMKRAPHGLEMVTILNDIHSAKLTAANKLPRLCGQEIVYPGERAPSLVNAIFLE